MDEAVGYDIRPKREEPCMRTDDRVMQLGSRWRLKHGHLVYMRMPSHRVHQKRRRHCDIRAETAGTPQ